MSLVLSLVLSLTVAPARAQDPEISGRAVVGGRALVSAPVATQGLVSGYSADFGIEFKDGNGVVMRITYLPSVPESALSSGADWGVGPVIGYERYVRVSRALDFHFGVAGGVFYGPGPQGQNVIVPTLQTGVGPRFRVAAGGNDALYVKPELCFVVTALAPCAAVSVGGFLPL